MGLLDGLRGKRQIALTPRAAMLLASMSMVAADGDIDDDGTAIIRRIDCSENTPDWDKAKEAWKHVSGPNECVDLTSPHLNEEQRRFTIANLIDIAMADGVLAGTEQRLLERYLESFELDEGFNKGVVDVVSVKNHQAPFV